MYTNTYVCIYIYIYFFSIHQKSLNAMIYYIIAIIIIPIIIIPSAQISVSNTINKRMKTEILRDILNGVIIIPSTKILNIYICFCCFFVTKSYPTLLPTHELKPTTFLKIHGISQARIMKWVIISFSRRTS